jgi:hypothetical protein
MPFIQGAKSFADLRTVNGQLYPTFKAACLALGLLEDDSEWIHCLQEAGDIHTGSQLRNLLATIMLHCNPTSPENLWNQFKDKICDDLARAITRINPHISEPTSEDIYDYGLYLLEKILFKSGKSLADFPSMPHATKSWGLIADNPLLQEQLDYDTVEMAEFVRLNSDKFNEEQKTVFDAVMASVDENQGKTFFLHSAGGGGKTFVCNTVAAAVRSREKVALCVASSGIASLLLDGGRTSHSRFHIPIPIHDKSFCTIKKGSDLHRTLQSTGVIIWDEVPMQHKHCIEALDRTLRDLLNKDAPFGGITILFGGDFRQTLPVVPHGIRGQIINASLCKSPLWSKVQMFHLHQNMRLDRTPESDEFAQWLLKVGSGEASENAGTVTLPQEMRCGNTVKDLINVIYPRIDIGGKPDQYFLDRTLLCCKNDDVNDINQAILSQFPGEDKVLMSADSVTLELGVDADFNPYPVEFLNSIQVSGLPLSHLKLKEGCPLMLLRNLDPANGLCNGSRMVLLKIQSHVLQCRILGGKHAGKIAFIPRINLEPSSEQLPIKLRHRQFPVHLAFAMTVNKAQGQSVKHVGLNLQTPVFSHGQLYVALSRCTSKDRIKVLFPEGQVGNHTPNIVYPEILTGIL